MFSEPERAAFCKILHSRKSVRAFKPDEVPPAVVERLLETLRRSASAANRQPWRFIPARRSEHHPLYTLVKGRPFEAAPLLVMGLADERVGWVRRGDGSNYARTDVTIAFTEMILAATAEGLGTCWVAAFDPQAARNLLGLPPGVEPVAIVAVGYPLERLEPHAKERKELRDILLQHGWEEP